MARPIDAGVLQDNLTDIYGDENRLVYLKDVLDLIDEQPTLTPPNEPLTLEQLREMDGKLVGIGDANGSIAENAIVNSKAGFSIGKSGTVYYFSDYGSTWLSYAYRQPADAGSMGHAGKVGEGVRA